MERLLITRVKRTSTTQADLFAPRHRYADLRLFELSELVTVGIDPASLPIGEEQPCRFWAVYELSDKLNQKGNPYKDVVALEAIDAPATSTSVDNSALLQELRAIRALLQALATAGGLVVDVPAVDDDGADPELDEAFPRYLDGAPVGDKPAEIEAYQAHVQEVGKAPASLEALRAWYAAHRGAVEPATKEKRGKRADSRSERP